MGVEFIKQLDVQSISADNSVLFLWATSPFLPQALDVMAAWGFTYKTVAFYWVKLNKQSRGQLFFTIGDLHIGMGNYTRSNGELCLLGVRGKPLERKSHKVRSVIISNIQKHSEKPQEAREGITQLFGGATTKIELFARGVVEGWDGWGDGYR